MNEKNILIFVAILFSILLSVTVSPIFFLIVLAAIFFLFNKNSEKNADSFFYTVANYTSVKRDSLRQDSYFLLTLIIVLLSYLSGIYFQSESSITLAGLALYVIDINYVTIPRLRDTNFSYKLRHLCYIPPTHIILKLVLFFKESSKERPKESIEKQDLKKSEKILSNSKDLITVVVKKTGKKQEIKKSDWDEIVMLGNEDMFEIIKTID